MVQMISLCKLLRFPFASALDELAFDWRGNGVRRPTADLNTMTALKVERHSKWFENEWSTSPQKINSLFSKPKCPTCTKLRDFQRIVPSLGFSESIGLMRISAEARKTLHKESPACFRSNTDCKCCRHEAESRMRHSKCFPWRGDRERGRS
jgi:hypothetical protein